MKGYKAFDRDLKCDGFQFEVGKEYRIQDINPYSQGFCAFENPIDMLGTAPPVTGKRYFTVELDEVSDEYEGANSEICGKTLKLISEINEYDICSAHYEFVKDQCPIGNFHITGNWGAVSSPHGGLASAGYCGVAASSETGTASTGVLGVAAVGAQGVAVSDTQGIAVVGYSGMASAGNYGIAVAGNWGGASAGKNGFACCRFGKAKGDIGCAICVVETDGKGNNIGVAAAIVDNVKIKANTWYIVKEGKFEELDEIGE